MDREALIRSVMEGRVWEDFCDGLRSAGRIVLDAAPEDAFDRAEGLRYVGRLATHALRSFLEESDPAHPRLSASTPKIGGDNPDFVYTNCVVSGRFEYRLRGERADAQRIGFGTYHGGLGTPEGLQSSGYLTDADLAIEADGSFEIALSARPQAGNWLPMRPETNQLTIRQTLLDRRREAPARFEIARCGSPEPPAPLDPAQFASSLGRARGFVEGVTRQFVAWSQTFAARPNQLHPIPPELASTARGDPSTLYYNGYFELAEDQALVVDLEPPRCEYWNLQVCNHWLESLDFMEYTTHYNQKTAKLRPDGSVRIAIARRDPGVPNWIDTAGHARGAIALRWVNADRDSQPRTRVVGLSELASGRADPVSEPRR
jgi:hypothetical protein